MYFIEKTPEFDKWLTKLKDLIPLHTKEQADLLGLFPHDFSVVIVP